MTWRKSTYSGGATNSCVEVGAWRKSTFSENGGSACVEVGAADSILVRDTTNRNGSTLAFPAAAWQGFTTNLR